MALTPEDVVKKEFTKPKGFGRSGYDEIQVDDFLDEIVIELRRLNAENEDLTSKLEECRRSKGVTGREQVGSTPAASGASAVPGLTPVAASSGRDAAKLSGEVTAAQDKLAAVKAETARSQEAARAAKDAQAQIEAQTKQAQDRLVALRTEIDKAESDQREAQSRAASAAQQPPAPAALAAAAPAAAEAAAPGGDVSGMIVLAQRLHDEHVSEGKTARQRLITEGEQHRDKVVGEATTKREELLKQGQAKYDELVRTGQSKYDELVTTGQSKHDTMVKDATNRSTTMISDAESKKATILTQLNTERDRLTSDIEQLRSFERDYRSKLKGYIEGQLKQLDHAPMDAAKSASTKA